jgi:hypothetical protein
MKHILLIKGIIFSTFGTVQLYQMSNTGPCSKHCGSIQGCVSGESYIQFGWTDCEIRPNGSCEVRGSHCDNNGRTPQRL